MVGTQGQCAVGSRPGIRQTTRTFMPDRYGGMGAGIIGVLPGKLPKQFTGFAVIT